MSGYSYGSGTHIYANDGNRSITFSGSGTDYYVYYQWDYQYGYSYPVYQYQTNAISGSISVAVLNVAPSIASRTLNGVNGDITVNEGEIVTMQMSSTDPGTDAHTFTIDGLAAGTGGTSGTRWSSIVERRYVQNGVYTPTFKVADDDTFTQVTRTVTVVNVAPTLATMSDRTVDRTINPTATFSASATDPGSNDVLTYTWDLDGDGQFDDGNATGLSGATAFATADYLTNGTYTLGVRVDDGDGGVDTQYMNLTVVPEPSGAVPFGLAALGLAARRRRRGTERGRSQGHRHHKARDRASGMGIGVSSAA
ncbi:MAG: PKD domain-containing protein [Planctomycetia bacterium]|nr:PKD domain-containing protein [Planctomycetia bacterium]